MAARTTPHSATRTTVFRGTCSLSPTRLARSGSIMVGFRMSGKFGRYMAYRHPQRVLGQVLIAPPGPGILQLAREAFVPWLDAAPDPKRFREILLPFTKRPIQEDLLALYCQNVSLASRAGL